MFNVNDIRQQFPILSREVNRKPLIYLDNAATSQKPQCVIDKVNFMHSQLNANIHRGIHLLAEETTREYEEAREVVARFINARSVREVVFTSGATASINTVAYTFAEKFFQRGDNMILTEMEHHSNIVPWQLAAMRYGVEVRVLPFDDEGRLEVEKLAELLDERTRIVAVTQTSNVLGTTNDISSIVAQAHAAGAKVLVDGCQGVVHNSVDVQSLGCDFYAFSGHKIFAPTGIGVLWGREELLEELPPFLGGGDMISTVSLTAGSTWAELPLKFEAGTSNFIGAVGMGEAIRFIEGLDREAAEAHQHTLLKHFSERLVSEVSGSRIYGTQSHKAPICSFTIEGTHPMDLAQIIDKLGVAMRSGTHCAEPIMTHYGLSSMGRVSFAPYNTLQEVDIAIEALKRATSMLR